MEAYRKEKQKRQKYRFNLTMKLGKNFATLKLRFQSVTRRINELIQSEDMKKLNYKSISDWLIQAGFLVLVTNDDGSTTRKPTDNGIQMGITLEQRQGQNRVYTVVVYNKVAQQFILDNLDAAIELSQR